MTRDNFITVLGAGWWGTALALVLARNGQEVRLWSREKDHVDAMCKERVNNRYLPNYYFPETLHVSDNLESSLNDVIDILIVVRVLHFRK